MLVPMQAVAPRYEVENRESHFRGIAMRRLTHMYSCNSYRTDTSYTSPSAHLPGCSYFEAESSHAAPVLIDGALALCARVGSGREQHALVALRLLLFAYAARLSHGCVSSGRHGYLSQGVTPTLGLEAAASELAAALLFAPRVREAASRAVVSSKLSIGTADKPTHVDSLRVHDVSCVVRWVAADKLFEVITEDGSNL